jgi:hypothetical protein
MISAKIFNIDGISLLNFNPINYPALNMYHYTVPIMESMAAPARTQKALK